MDFYLLILGETNEKKKDILVNRAKSLGKIKEIMFSALILEHEGDLKRAAEIRDKMAGKERFKLLAIRLNQEFISAWSMSRESSEYLKSIFEEIYGTQEKN